MDTHVWIDQLTKEGFQEIQSHTKPAHTAWPEHTHDKETVHVIIEGELVTNDSSGENVYHAGDRFDVPAGGTHSAKCGPAGCTFIVGWK